MMPALFDLGANLGAVRAAQMQPQQMSPPPSAPGLMQPMPQTTPQPAPSLPQTLFGNLEQGISSPLFLAGLGLATNGSQGLMQGLQTGNQLRQLPLERMVKEAQARSTLAQAALAGRPKFQQIGEGELGGKQYGFVDPMTGNIKPYQAPGGEGSGGAISDIANAIKTGQQPPELTGLYRHGAKVRAALARDDVDLTQLQLEYQSAKKQVSALNGPQMVRFAGLAHSVVNTIDRVKELSQQMELSGLTPYNKAKLIALVNTAGNTPRGQLASQYLAAVNTLKEEFANLAQGGYAPTEAAWHLADQQINADYGVKQLNSALNEVQRLIRYRIQGIPNFERLGPGAANRYVGGGEAYGADHAPAPQSAQPTPQPGQGLEPGEYVFDPATGQLRKK
jgi:uncharacterized phage infection (PIP) family protein YhgE